jgi:hypothetical protein
MITVISFYPYAFRAFLDPLDVRNIGTANLDVSHSTKMDLRMRCSEKLISLRVDELRV